MASKDHFERIQQGAYAWNRWRESREREVLDLICAELPGADLVGVDLVHAEIPRANFSGARLSGANLSGATAAGANFACADLGGAHLIGTVLSGANLAEANLALANLSGANLMQADLRGANLMHANLIGANLLRADLSGANLSGADLSGANLIQANLERTNLGLAILSQTVFGGVRLASTTGLESCVHVGPSVIDSWTLARSGSLPPVFLQGCGLPDPRLGQMYACYIAYASDDQDFAERLHADLQSKGVRCWLAPSDRGTGGRFRRTLNESLGPSDQLVLVLSPGAVRNGGLEKRIDLARQREKEWERLLLFPVWLDGAMLDDAQILAPLRVERPNSDFRAWKDPAKYWPALGQLIQALLEPSGGTGVFHHHALVGLGATCQKGSDSGLVGKR